MGLASIQVVNRIRPIQNADRVELADILGWHVMVKKDTMAAGDKVVYFEIDSLLPDIPQFAFLSNKGFPYRLKTEKYFKGAVTSQGLALLASDFGLNDCEIGADVTAILNISKYEKQIDVRLGGDNAGSFPSYVPKTDEIRLQAIPQVLNEIVGWDLYVTQKCDGTSATYLYDRENDDFIVCSRNWQKKHEDNIYAKIAERYNLREILKNTSYAIQGEICGEGIQKNQLGIDGHKLFIFNIYDYAEHKYLTFEEVVEFCCNHGDTLDIVPLLYTIEDMPNTWNVDDFVDFSKGIYLGTQNQREGIVVRSMTNEFSQVLGGRLSFKVINPDYRD